MTQPRPPSLHPTPDCDPGNNMLGPAIPATLTTKVVPTSQGPHVMHTVRCPGATMTVFLNKRDAETWGRQLLDAAGGISASGLLTGSNGG